MTGTESQGKRRARAGRQAWHSGCMAEDQIASRYRVAGCDILARRWRGKAGEIDLIVREGSTIVFVEVKASATHGCAAERLGRRQMDRICQAACEYCSRLPDGQATEMRFDAALVDSLGRVEILRNAFGEA